MSLTADTTPSLQACQHCSLTFRTSRELDRHVALDHTPDVHGADLVALITAPGTYRGSPSAPGTQPRVVTRPTGPSAAASPTWWRSTSGHLVLAAYGLVALFASAPLLATTLCILALLVVACHARVSVRAWVLRRPAPGRPPVAQPPPGQPPD